MTKLLHTAYILVVVCELYTGHKQQFIYQTVDPTIPCCSSIVTTVLFSPMFMSVSKEINTNLCICI